jgi:vitamin B12 transporter
MKAIRMCALWLLASGASTSVLGASADLPPLVITATRTGVSEDRVIAPVTIIDREELDRSLSPDVADLLRFQGGIEISRNGGPGQVTSVFIRGAESDHTLVLIDGVRMNSGTAGVAAIQNVSPDLIERIEIVKGPRSSLYGSEAVGGVINIITRSDQDTARVRGEIGGGRYGTRHASGGVNLSGSAGSAGLNVSWYDTDGFPTREASESEAGYDNLGFDAWARTELGPVAVDVGHWQARGTTEYSDFFLMPVDQDYTNEVSRIQLGARPMPTWRSTLSLDRVVDEIQQGSGAVDPADFTRTERYTADWQNALAGPAGLQLVAGIYVARETTSGQIFGSRLEERPGSGDVKIDVDAAYLETTFSGGRHEALLAARHTDHQIFGGQNSWNMEYGVNLTGTLRFTVGAGRAFRAPTSLDLYGYGGNPELDPEVSRNVDISLTKRVGSRHEFRAGAFRNRIDDLIEFVFTDPDSFTGENRNVDEAEIEGIELGYFFRGDDWRFRANATFQDPRNKTTGEKLLRRSDRVLTLSVLRRLGLHDLGLDILASGSRQDFGGTRLGGYVLANLSSRIQLGEHWQLKAKVENLLDRDYELADGYRSAGRGVYASLAYSY